MYFFFFSGRCLPCYQLMFLISIVQHSLIMSFFLWSNVYINISRVFRLFWWSLNLQLAALPRLQNSHATKHQDNTLEPVFWWPLKIKLHLKLNYTMASSLSCCYPVICLCLFIEIELKSYLKSYMYESLHHLSMWFPLPSDTLLRH